MTDPISDLLTRIKNGLRVGKKRINAPYSRIKVGILKILKEKDLIGDFKVVGEIKKQFLIDLKYDENNNPLIEDLKRVSKPGQRVYLGYKELKPLKSGFAFRIISTSRGLMTDIEARKRKLGGEVICEVYF